MKEDTDHGRPRPGPEQPHVAMPRIRLEPDFEERWPGASALATACVLNLTMLCQHLEAYSHALVRAHGLPSPAAFNVLAVLHGAGEPLPPSTIAERLIVTRQTLTGLLDSLSRRGLVHRRPHDTDRRMVLVELTPEGRARVERFLPQLHQAERRWMDCLSAEQQRTLVHLVELLQAHLPPRPPESEDAAP